MKTKVLDKGFIEVIDSLGDDLTVDDTATLVNEYVDNVRTDLDKDRIKLEISTLMTEAQNMEIL